MSPASPEVHAAYADFKVFKQMSDEGRLIVEMPPETWTPETGGMSFNLRSTEWIARAITQDPDYAEYVGEHFLGPDSGPLGLLGFLFEGVFFGVEAPQVIVVFQNGDVAIYEIRRPHSPSGLDTSYVEGTARDSNGNPISDGSGTVTGDSYVAPWIDGIKIWPGDDSYVWVICWRTGSGPWTCYIPEDQE